MAYISGINATVIELIMYISLAIADSCRYDPIVPDREIEFTACCMNIMGAMGINPDFTK